MAAFRDIRPASEHVPSPEAQPSPAPSSEAGSSAEPHAGNPARVRKRRAPAHVSQNACTNCKRARAKCDGHEPDPCSRCLSRDLADQCHYEVHVKTAKEEMVRRIKSLEQQNAELQGSVRERDHQIEAIFAALKNDKRGPEAIARLRSGQSYQEIVSWLGSPPGDVGRLSPGTETKLANIVQEYEDSMQVDTDSQSSEPDTHSGAHWTFASPGLTNHLMNLFFTWVHPFHMLFSEECFMDSFHSGDRRYCSPALVNMMCAMGCFYHVDQGGEGSQPKALLRRFFEHGFAELSKEDPKTLTFAPTYALLFLVELGLKQARKASSHLRLAVESLVNLDKPRLLPAAVEITSRGIHTLSVLWASLTNQKPVSALSSHFVMSNAVERDRADAFWQPYRYFQDKGAALVPSQAIATSEAMTKLGQIIREMISVYCGRRESVTAHLVVGLCRRFLEWKQSLAHSLAVTNDGVTLSHPLPHVLALHIHYHVAFCALFRPILEIDNLPEKTRRHLHSITLQSALDGFKLLERYRSLYTHRYQTPLLAFCVAHLCGTLVQGAAGMGDIQQRAVQFALEATYESLDFDYVGPLQYMFCQRVLEAGLKLPPEVEQLMGGRTDYGPEDMLDTCERVSYTQPYKMLRERVDRNLGVEFESVWRQLVETQGAAGSSQWVGGGSGGLGNADLATRRSDSNSSSASGGSSARSMQINSVVNP